MQNSSILYILRSNGIEEEDLKVFEEKLKKDKEFTLDKCDKLLEKMGYEKLFLVDNDDFDDEDGDYYPSYEQSPKDRHKKEEESFLE